MSKTSKGGGVYQFCALRAPDADPPHFRPIPSGPPPKMQVLSVHPPQIDCTGENFEKKILWNHPKKAKKLQIYSIIRPYLMKNVDPPPILATLFSKQQIPPHIRVKFKETPPKLVEFHIHSPQNRWKWSTPCWVPTLTKFLVPKIRLNELISANGSSRFQSVERVSTTTKWTIFK